MNTLNIPIDNRTPKGGNRFDCSPGTNLSMQGFKSPMNQFVFRQDDDGSKGMPVMIPGEDFGSKFYALSKQLNYFFQS
jgi:hypothetical protein